MARPGPRNSFPGGRCHIGENGVLPDKGYHKGRSESTSLGPSLLYAKRSKPSQPKVVTCSYVAVTVRRGWERLGCWRKWRPIHPPLRPEAVVAAKRAPVDCDNATPVHGYPPVHPLAWMVLWVDCVGK
jgi:hypothetical protein